MGWAASLLPLIEKMAGVILRARQESMRLHNTSSPLYGLACGFPEADLAKKGLRSYFFSVNAWMVRGLSDLHIFLQESSLSHDQDVEVQLGPVSQDWRARIQLAAAFTAVRS